VINCRVFGGRIDGASVVGTFDYNWLGGPAGNITNNSSEPWFGANNIIDGDNYIWWPVEDPDWIVTGTAAENAALDIFSAPFSLGGTSFDFTSLLLPYVPPTSDPRDMGAMTI